VTSTAEEKAFLRVAAARSPVSPKLSLDFDRNAPVVRNAIGVPVHQPSASRNAPVVRNAIGLPLRQPNASPNALGAAKKPINTQLTASINHSMINGTGVGRPGSGTVAIGVPKRKVVGVIDGTSFRPRHP
jgi:hypothetical protein